MKGILQVVAALLLLNVAALTLWSRAAPPPPAARSTRVAVFNLTRVMKNYEKFKTYQIELKQKVDPFQKRDTELKTEGGKLAEEAKDGTLTAEQHTQLEKKLAELVKLIEDNKAEAQALLVKAQEKQLQSLYNDVETAARRLAKQRGYDLVMHFNDAQDEAERRSPANVARKMQAGGLMPIFVEQGVDLSEAILEELHKDMKRESL